MNPNIFSIAFNYVRLGDEDMVTALWHYVLSSVPGVGQAFVDDFCRRAGIQPRGSLERSIIRAAAERIDLISLSSATTGVSCSNTNSSRRSARSSWSDTLDLRAATSGGSL